jgi:hypothetical protein
VRSRHLWAPLDSDQITLSARGNGLDGPEELKWSWAGGVISAQTTQESFFSFLYFISNLNSITYFELPISKF